METDKTKQNNKRKDLLSIIIPIVSVVFILGMATTIFLLAKGYRINIYDKEIKTTGVLAIETNPTITTIYINGEEKGNTPRSTTLDIGTYDITIKKDKYRDWERKISILEGKSTILNPWLILENNTKTTVWDSKMQLENIWTNETNNMALIEVKDSEGANTIWRYNINTYLWDFSQNPSEILITTDTIKDITLSPNGLYAIATITNTNGDITTHLWNTSKSITLDDSSLIDTTGYENYTKTWAKNSRYIILESESEIISYNIITKSNTILIKKEEGKNYIWTTDGEEHFYLVRELQDSDTNLFTYKIEQYKLDGTGSKDVIERIYLQTDKSYIDYYRNNIYTQSYFVNSPENTQTVGEITNIDVNKNMEGMFIKTTSASYWYDMETEKYILISPYPSNVIDYSTDNKKILYQNDISTFFFIAKKDEGDHTREIGSTEINNIENATNIHWVSNSTYIYYTQDNYIYISDKFGNNKYKIVPTENINNYILETSKDYLITFETDTTKNFSINKYAL